MSTVAQKTFLLPPPAHEINSSNKKLEFLCTRYWLLLLHSCHDIQGECLHHSVNYRTMYIWDILAQGKNDDILSLVKMKQPESNKPTENESWVYEFPSMPNIVTGIVVCLKHRCPLLLSLKTGIHFLLI